MFTRTPNFALVTLMILGVSSQHEGLEISLVRTESPTDDKLCNQLICRVQGMSVFIDDVTISKVSVGGVSRKLMTTSTNSPESSIVDTTTKGNGTLKDNSATLFIDFLSYKFETLKDRLDRRLNQNIDTVNRRANTLENSVLGRVSSVETDFFSRFSRLEDRVSSILLSESPDTSSDVAQSLADMERRLKDLTAAVKQVNDSKVALQDDGHQDPQPVVCERSMGDVVTKTYPRYVITTDQTIQRQVLCETQTDGGGWIVIQRRAAGDVDFYRDWTA
ncbi:hypothetical protein RRG08_061097 [Elysia crispata]|uniref:Fibrinogen C-terminal domain-containing protein n=1 Tax=Elysia crispata TaxID=231223 RepID=A0AAE1D606_9GAST|nr:hypothetical protein RRG08_061097 [Elysia crispata]